MRFSDLSRCLLYGVWLPSDPRSVLDLFKNRRSVGHKNWACTGAESWASGYVYCNNWSLANSADPHFYYPVAAVADVGDWMRRGVDHRRPPQHACAGLIILLLLAFATGLEMAAAVSALAVALVLWRA